MTYLRLLCLSAALLATGCVGFKPVVKTIDDVARFFCAQHFSEAQKVSIEDAWEAYCKTREAWAPWVDPLLEAKQQGNLAAPAPQPPVESE